MKNTSYIYAFLLVMMLLPWWNNIQAITAVQYGAKQVEKDLDKAWNELKKKVKIERAKEDPALEQRVLKSLEALKTSSPALYKKKLAEIQGVIATDKIIRQNAPTIAKSITITTSLTPPQLTTQFEQQTEDIMDVFGQSNKTVQDINKTSQQLVALENVVTPINPQLNVQERITQTTQLTEPEKQQLLVNVSNVQIQDNIDPKITQNVNEYEFTWEDLFNIDISTIEPAKEISQLTQEAQNIQMAITTLSADIRQKSTTLDNIGEYFQILIDTKNEIETTLVAQTIDQSNYQALLEELGNAQSAFTETLFNLMQNQFKKFEKTSLFGGTGSTEYLKDRCSYLDQWITQTYSQDPKIQQLKGKITTELNKWKLEYIKYVTPVVDTMNKVKEIFDNLNVLGESFTNMKDEFTALVRIYVFGANKQGEIPPKWKFWAKKTTYIGQYDDDIINNPTFNDISIAGLLTRYLDYVEAVFIGKENSNFDPKQDSVPVLNLVAEVIQPLTTNILNLFDLFSSILHDDDKAVLNIIKTKFNGIIYNIQSEDINPKNKSRWDQ